MTHGDYTNRGKHLVMYVTVKGLCTVSETHVILYVDSPSITKVFFKGSAEFEEQRPDVMIKIK